MNLFFIEIGSPYSFDLAIKLEDIGFKVTHITTVHDKKVYNSFCQPRSCKVINSRILYKSQELFNEYEEYFINLNKEILDFFNVIERDFYILSDRTNHQSIPFRTRKSLFCDLIRFWLGYLNREPIDFVYFPYTPHTGWELVLMQACRYLKIPYCYLSHTAINNRSLLRTNYDFLEPVPDIYLSGKTLPEIRNDIDPALLKDFEEESIVTSIVKLENDFFHNQTGTNSKTEIYRNFLKTGGADNKILKRTARLVLEKLPFSKISYKTPFHLQTAMDFSSSQKIWHRAVKTHRKRALALKKLYQRYAKPLSYDKPFIYFPMHLQPELTSQPEAGIFEDHLLALETLLAALPDGWLIYLKENPRQFDTTLNTVSGMHYRDGFDYKRFIAHERVVLVPQNVPTETLIENAEIVVTLTGTAGWESLNMGKPCMVFAHPWYSPCRSCFIVKTPADVRLALKRAAEKTKHDVKVDLMKYLHFYQDRLKIATLHAPSDVSYNSRSYEELVQHQAQALFYFSTISNCNNDVTRQAEK